MQQLTYKCGGYLHLFMFLVSCFLQKVKYVFGLNFPLALHLRPPSPAISRLTLCISYFLGYTFLCQLDGLPSLEEQAARALEAFAKKTKRMILHQVCHV